MTIRHLKIFIAVYDELNMTSAANKLFMTQPSVSQAIREIEEYYGIQMFERISRKLYITDAGKNLYQYATHIISLFSEVEDILKEGSSKVRINIGVNYTVGTLIHNYIEEFKKIYPNADVKVKINNSSFIINMIRKNELDIALVEEVKESLDLVQKVFRNDRILAVAHKDHYLASMESVTLKDITCEKLLLREKGSGVRSLFDLRVNEKRLMCEPYWESTSSSALIKAAENKIGIAILPYELVKHKIGLGDLKEIKINDVDFSRNLVVLYHKNKMLTKAMKNFIKICYTI